MARIIKKASEWDDNDKLKAGDIGEVSDSNSPYYCKVGDGVKKWSELQFVAPPVERILRLNGRIRFREIPDENSEAYSSEVPLRDEIGVKPGDDDNTHFFKIGDGEHTWSDLPWKTGPRGIQGIPGSSIVRTFIDQQGNLFITLSDGRTYNAGNVIGPYITSAVVTSGGALWLELSNGRKLNCGNVRGPQGPQGYKGDTGPQGIQGPKGDKGDPGETPDLSNYVTFDNKASGSNLGIIAPGAAGNGTGVDKNGILTIRPAEYTGIDNRKPENISRSTGGLSGHGAQSRNPITPSNIDYAVKKVLTDNVTDGFSLTVPERAAAKSKLGINDLTFYAEQHTDSSPELQLLKNTTYYIYQPYDPELSGNPVINLIGNPEGEVHTISIGQSCIIKWEYVLKSGFTPGFYGWSGMMLYATGDDCQNGTFTPDPAVGTHIYEIRITRYTSKYCMTVVKFS